MAVRTSGRAGRETEGTTTPTTRRRASGRFGTVRRTNVPRPGTTST